ncbi:universal stress protein [Actinomycetospora cinnamomea]|uniref:Nucleotide-binding universal stress UspA family protein n=1 Tax=Actinomycetospora cinnamomea TaxID=663609 RepID=A0A2U1F2B1_9PSEU|nr:universal stress protein [Actinomycetospora cinnamomea]PVZ06306.1 nucleotide-binding universal stress UspA family protein [Actinomycetospora cinnamomea]
MNEQEHPGPIVVGIDGSVRSVEALRWAADMARLTGAEVHAVTAWEVPVTIMLVPSYTEADYAREARAVLDRAVAEVQESAADVKIEKHLVQQRPALVLGERAENAQMLVLGSHGRGDLPGMHLGSTASYCVHHAPCPVVVVRGRPA